MFETQILEADLKNGMCARTYKLALLKYPKLDVLGKLPQLSLSTLQFSQNHGIENKTYQDILIKILDLEGPKF